MKFLTIDKLKEMEPGTVFAKGNDKHFAWMAKRGGIHDWAMYEIPIDKFKSWELLERRGEKCFNEQKIRERVECEQAAWEMYRK